MIESPTGVQVLSSLKKSSDHLIDGQWRITYLLYHEAIINKDNVKGSVSGLSPHLRVEFGSGSKIISLVGNLTHCAQGLSVLPLSNGVSVEVMQSTVSETIVDALKIMSSEARQQLLEGSQSLLSYSSNGILWRNKAYTCQVRFGQCSINYIPPKFKLISVSAAKTTENSKVAIVTILIIFDRWLVQ